MPANLPLLAPTDGHVEVQDTTFTRDTLGRYICNTLEEATTNPDFDAIVIGAGMYGGYCAERIYRSDKRPRVLVLDAGSFLVPEHLQNLPRMDLYTPPAGDPIENRGAAHSLVWGFPYRSNEASGGQAYCVGGKSLYWGGWAARLTPEDLRHWPDSVRGDLEATYPLIERMIGREKPAGYLDNELTHLLVDRLNDAGNRYFRGVEVAPVAACGCMVPGSSLFAFDKFSSAALLIRAVREAVRERLADGERRLFVVPGVRVLRLATDDGDPPGVNGLEISVNGGGHQHLSLHPGCSVVLALGAVESTRLALESVPRSPFREQELMGRNLTVHLRCRTVVRVRREALRRGSTAAAWQGLRVGAVLVRGQVNGRSYHMEVTAVDDPEGGSDDILYHAVPDLELFQAILEARHPEFVTLVVRGFCEMAADRRVGEPKDRAPCWVDLSPYEDGRDEWGKPRAYVRLEATLDDQARFKAMKQHIASVVDGLGNRPAEAELLLPTTDEPLGTSYHEAGTLWMGDDPASSVTGPGGRFHHVHNLFCADQALFPTSGSVGPVLTGLALADRVAREVIAARSPRPQTA